jgi:hypothetical protein
MLTLTDFQGYNTLKDYEGWALVIVLVFAVLVNLFKALTLDFIALIKWLKKKLCNKT